VSKLVLKVREACEEPYIEFYVDGENLGGRVKSALGEAGFDDVLPWYGGDYRIEETVLGESARRTGVEGAILFACGCGQYACGGVSASVVIAGEMLILRDIFTGRGGQRVVASIEPITFDRKQFEEAVSQLQREIEVWHPPGKP
jgi:hypothetical protein